MLHVNAKHILLVEEVGNGASGVLGGDSSCWDLCLCVELLQEGGPGAPTAQGPTSQGLAVHPKDPSADGDNVCGCDEPLFKRDSEGICDLFLHPHLRDCFLHHVQYL